MLLVRTKVAPSKIHGLGLFACQFIPKNTIIWEFTPGFDQKFTKEQILSFPELLQLYLCRYGWKSRKSGLYFFAADNGKYFNHSDDANCFSMDGDDEGDGVTVALRDIAIGDEITDNYASFEDYQSNDNVLKHIAEKHGLMEGVSSQFQELRLLFS